MKNFVPKLVVLADNLDRIGLKKDADKIDLLISHAARGGGEDFDDLIKLFDEPVALEDREDDAPRGRGMSVPDEDNVDALSTESDEPVGTGKGKDPKKDRLKELMRRHELLKLKKQMGLPPVAPTVVDDDEEEAEETGDEVELPIASPDELAEFEDEGDADTDEESDADDGLLDELKSKLEGAPELAKQLLVLVRDNPELLELLAL